MRGAGVRMQQAHADRAHAMPAKVPRGEANALLVEGPQLPALEVEPSTDLAHEFQRHDALGLDPEIGVAVTLRNRLPRNLQNVPETLGDDQAERLDFPLQQRVRCHRRAVGEPGQVVHRPPSLPEDPHDAPNQPDRGVFRRARNLGDLDVTRSAVHSDDVGKRAAGVNADTQAGGGGRTGHDWKRVPCCASWLDCCSDRFLYCLLNQHGRSRHFGRGDRDWSSTQGLRQGSQSIWATSPAQV